MMAKTLVRQILEESNTAIPTDALALRVIRFQWNIASMSRLLHAARRAKPSTMLSRLARLLFFYFLSEGLRLTCDTSLNSSLIPRAGHHQSLDSARSLVISFHIVGGGSEEHHITVQVVKRSRGSISCGRNIASGGN